MLRCRNCNRYVEGTRAEVIEIVLCGRCVVLTVAAMPAPTFSRDVVEFANRRAARLARKKGRK